MTPHPTTVKAAREIDDYEPFLRYMDYAANADCDAAQERVNAEVAAIIEESCHVSEMVEAATLILERFENDRDKSGDTDHAFLDHCYHCWSRKMAYDLREVLAKVSHER